MSNEKQVEQLTTYMANFIAPIAKKLPDDVIAKLTELRDKEDSPLSKTIYDTMFRNQELAVKLLKFCDKDGNELTDQMNQASGTITFSSAGKYSFTVKAVDSGNRKTTVVIHVPVM